MSQSQNMVVIRTLAEMESLRAYLEDKQFVAFDTETTGVVKGSEIIGFSVCADPQVGYYVVLAEWDVKTQSLRYLETREGAKSFLDSLRSKSLVPHNGGFDCSMVENNFGVSLIDSVHTDTMLLAHLLDENRRVGLKELGTTIFGESATKEQAEMKASVAANGGQLTKDAYELYKADSELIARYGAKDAILTLNLFYHLVPELYAQGLDKFFYEDETMPLMRGPTYEMNNTGLMVDKAALSKLKATLETDCLEAEAFILKEIKEHIQDKYPGTNKKNQFNISSSSQVAWLLFIKLGQEFNTLTDTGKEVCKALGLKLPYSFAAKRDFIRTCEQSLGQEYELGCFNPKTGKTTKGKKVREPQYYMACDKEALKKHAKKYRWVEKLLEHAKNTKLLNTYVEGIEERVRYNIIRPDFLQHGTTSGRYSCIAEGQMVSMPGGDKPIEQVQIGDLVYCYTEDGNPVVRKVTNKFDNGLQECMELTWRSKGSHKTGTLVCTPDHRIKHRGGKWIEAQHLWREARVYHLRRGVSLTNGRVRIYGANYFMKNEEQLIKETYFLGNSSEHVHHINEVKSDNRIENLKLLSGEEHSRLHGKEAVAKRGTKLWEHLLLPKNRPEPTRGSENPLWIHLTRFQLLRLLAKIKGRPSRANMDFNTLKKKANLLGIDLRLVKQRYNYKGEYLSRGRVRRSVDNNMKLKDQAAHLGVNQYRFKELVREHGLEANHTITGYRNVGIHQVYDLEVEGEHNFIVNEICVHNCRNPNFQNLPRDDKRIKACIVSRPGKVFVGADYSQLEPRVFASFSKDTRLLECFKNGDDFYSVVGTETFDKYDCTLKKDDENSFAKKYPQLRNISKVVALSATYGTTAPKMAPAIGKTREEAQEVIDAYFERFPSVKKFMTECHVQAMTTGQVLSYFNRPRRIPKALEIRKIYGDIEHSEVAYEYRNLLNLAVNHTIQSTAASIMNRAAIQFNAEAKSWASLEPIWKEVKIIMSVHDEIIIECPQELAEEVSSLLKDCMENTVKLPGVDMLAEPKIAHNLADLK